MQTRENMPISFQSILNSRLGVGLALGLGKSTPPRLGYRIASFVANQISARPNLAIVQAVRCNQAVVGGGKLPMAELNRRVTETFVQTSYCLYDLYHNLGNTAAIHDLLEWTPAIDQLVKGRQNASQGLTIVGVHMSNFDFVAQAATLRGLRVMPLGLPDPGGGYQWQNDLRKKAGFEIVPASVTALRQATKLLEQGGTVITGLDRPLAESKYLPRFFGRPAALPVMHILLALKTRTPLIVAAAFRDERGCYHIEISEPVSMQPYHDRHEEIVRNAETVLEIAAGFISRAPTQWSMFYPVWPDAG
jgi:phosphatidylinositol dimannoside acyltransferase